MKRISLYHPDLEQQSKWIDAFQKKLPSHQVSAWKTNQSSEYLVCWGANADIFQTKGLRVVFSLGAGVEGIVSSSDLDKSITIVRLEDAGMREQMLEVALYATIHYSRQFSDYQAAQQQKLWRPNVLPKKPFSIQIGVLGLGQLGGYVASQLAKLGYAVNGFSYSTKSINGVNCYCFEQLSEFLKNTELLINLLPLTEQTTGILNQSLFDQLSPQSYLVNLARGKHLVEEDLISAIDSGQLKGAFLDVFSVEPLPADHPFWSHPNIIVTPHIAAVTILEEAVLQISANILAYENQQPMTGIVDRKTGY